MKRKLNELGQKLHDEFEIDRQMFGGCSCHISPPCGFCLHPGNPSNLEETPEAWEPEEIEIVIPVNPVESSNILGVGYDAESKTMAVQFKSGGTYYYPEVPQGDYDALLAAKSIGKHYHSHIRGKFLGKKI